MLITPKDFILNLKQLMISAGILITLPILNSSNKNYLFNSLNKPKIYMNFPFSQKVTINLLDPKTIPGSELLDHIIQRHYRQ